MAKTGRATIAPLQEQARASGTRPIDREFRLSIETLSDVPLYAGRPSREVAPQRKAASWIVVGIVHLLLLNLLIFSQVFPARVPHGAEHETILDLSGSKDNNTPPVKIPIPQAPLGVPPQLLNPPVPPPPVIETQEPPPSGEQTPSDMLAGIGRSIACSPGNYENLTEQQRTRCGRIPWQGAQMPNGAIVLNRPGGINPFAPPPPEFRISGEDAQRLQSERGNPCPLLGNMPCLNRIPGRDD